MTDDLHVAWVIQRANSGAETQAHRIASLLDHDVSLVTGDPLDITHRQAGIRDDRGVIHPTQDLDQLIRSLTPVPDLVVFHNFNQHIREAVPKIHTYAPTAVRVGMNFAEATMLGGQMAATVPALIEFVRHHDIVIAPSEAAARDLRSVGIERDRIETIPTMVDLTDETMTEPDLNAPYGVGHVSTRCSPVKNQHLTVKMAAALREMDPTYRAAFNITGEQSQYRQTVEQTAERLNVSNLCRFVGYVDNMAEFWSSVGVSVLPSISERHPSVVMEAARQGVPTLAADTQWAEEFESVPTEPVDDAWAWATHLHDLLTNDSQRVRLAARQQEEMRDRFSVEAVAPQYAELFEWTADRIGPYKTDPEVVA